MPPEIQAIIEQHKAKELRRERQQGLGKPIIGAQFKGYQFVAVGGRLHYGKWKTFFEFLSDYIKQTIGSDWGNAEIAKPLEHRHPILQWYDAVCRYQQKMFLEPGKVHTAPATGATSAYFGLAYNLYLLAHNVALQRRLIARIKNPDQFRGAYYEIFVAACFILAGFELSLEDEGNPTSTHCEFNARSKITGKTYSVEAKSRAPNKSHLDVGNQLYAALTKTAHHPRIVFIDVNVPAAQTSTDDKWLGELVSAIKNRETTLKVNGQPAPPAFVIVTNHPYHYDLETTATHRGAVAVGFKIPDFGANTEFPGLIEAFKAMRKHMDLFRLLDTFRQYHVPSTFDGEVPEFAFGNAERRWMVGEQYELSDYEDGAVGVLENGIVSEQEKEAHLVFALQDGRRVIMRSPLTDAEVAAYRHHPETFFGVHQHVGRNITDPLALFEFIFDTYKNTSREKLLEFLRSASDFEQLCTLNTDELLLVFCDRHVGAVMRRAKTSAEPP